MVWSLMVPWVSFSILGTITVRELWCFPSAVMGSCGCWQLLNHVDLQKNKQPPPKKKQTKKNNIILPTVQRQFVFSCWTVHCVGYCFHCNRRHDFWWLSGVNEGGGDSGPLKADWPPASMWPDPPYRNTSVNKTRHEENFWLIYWRPASYSQTISSSSSTQCSWFCFHCNTSMKQELNIHFPLINSQFIPLPLPISLPFIMHYSPFLNDFILTVSSNLVFGYG